MGIERLEAYDERGFVDKFVGYVEARIEAHLKRSSTRFVLGVSCAQAPKHRARMAEIFSSLAESECINWSRVCVFLTDERWGAAEDSNAQIIQSTLLVGLHRRDITLSDDQLCLPKLEMETVAHCAEAYQKQLMGLFKAEGVDGPHLIVLALEADHSIAAIHPAWYHKRRDRWEEIISRSVKVLVTQTSHDSSEHRISINLGVVRRSNKIVVNVNESTETSWQEVVDKFESDAGQSRKPSTPRRTGSAPPERVLRKMAMAMPSSPQPESPSTHQSRLITTDETEAPPESPSRQHQPAYPIFQRSASPDGIDSSITLSPLDYIMKYKHITSVQLTLDEEHHLSLVVLGAAGDLAKKKTFPSLFQLYVNKNMPDHTRIVACDDQTFHPDVKNEDDFWEKKIRPYLEKESGWKPQDLRGFKAKIDFMPMKLTEPGTFASVHERIRDHAKNGPGDNRVFYLALPSSVFTLAIERLAQECFSKSGFSRVIVEKPFGRNLEEATELAQKLGRHVSESQIYRIDHYLAKTLVLNILTLRFANREFGTLFHQYHVSNIRITFQENFGVEGRAGYFDNYGIIRDIMQNHLMQVLTLIAMEAPASLDAEDVRDEKVKVLKQIRPITPENCVIGQYNGYQDEDGIEKINQKQGFQSRCPTFAVCVLYLDNERWSGVPFIMKAGKALKTTQTLVRVQFKKSTPHSLFGDQPQNELVIRIQPNEAIYYKMIAKMPGISQKAKDVRRTVLDLDLKKGAEGQKATGAYEKLIYDVIKGESHNFVRRDELEQAWRIFDPLLNRLEQVEKRVPLTYEKGSGGPPAADELMESVGFQKYTPTGVAVSGFQDDEVA